MRKLSTTTWLLIGVVGLGVVYFLMQYFGGSLRSSDYRETLVSFKREQLSRLLISQSKQVAELKRSSKGWEVLLLTGKAVDADTQQVEELIDLIERIKPTRIQAKTESAWPKLLLDTTGIRVEAFEENKKVLDIIIGKTEIGPNRGYQTYVRLKEDPISYVAVGISSFSIQPRANAYRPILLFNTKVDSISSVEFEDLSTGDKLLLEKKDSLWWLISETPQLIDNEIMWNYLSDVSVLSSNEFEDNFSSSAQPLRRVSLLIGDTKQQVDLYRSEDEWILRSSINQATFFRDSVSATKLWKSSNFFLALLP